MSKYIRKYNDSSLYGIDMSRETELGSVSLLNNSPKFDGVNVILDFKQCNCEIGDIIVIDKLENKAKILKEDTYNADSFDHTRYHLGNAVYFGFNGRKALFLDKTAAASATWAAPNQYILSGFDLSKSGSFTYSAVAYSESNSSNYPTQSNITIEWSAGATIDSIITAWKNKTNASGYKVVASNFSVVKINESSIGVAVTTISTGLFTINSSSGGGSSVTVHDCSEDVMISDVVLGKTHRSFQGSTLASLFPDANLIPVTSANYTKIGHNNTYMCGANLERFLTYCTTNGAKTFVAKGTNSWPMSKETFDNLIFSADAEQIALYDSYNGDYKLYIADHMTDNTVMKGVCFMSYKKNIEHAKKLAKIMFKDYFGNWSPVYPAAYNAVKASDEFFEKHLIGAWDISVIMEDSMLKALNKVISKLKGNILSNSSYYWCSSEYSSYSAWNFHGYSGTLYHYIKFNSLGVRSALAFNFES